MARALRTNHIGMTVANLDQAIARWCAVFGYRLRARGGRHPRGVELLTGVSGADIEVAHLNHPALLDLELIAYRGPADAGRIAARPCDTGHVHLTFDVDDVSAMVERAEASGFAITGRIVRSAPVPSEGAQVVYLHDPDGATVELIQQPTAI